MMGLAQLLLGAYILSNTWEGPFSNDPVAVAMFVVLFPKICITVSLIHMSNAKYGMARSFGFHCGPDDHIFHISTLPGFSLSFCKFWFKLLRRFEVLRQLLITLVLSIIVAFLDFQMCTTPKIISEKSNNGHNRSNMKNANNKEEE